MSGLAKDVPHSQIRQSGTTRGNRAEALARGGMLFGGGKVVGRSGSKGRNRQSEKITCSMKAVVLPLCGSGIMQLEIGKVGCSMTGDAIADFPRSQFCL